MPKGNLEDVVSLTLPDGMNAQLKNPIDPVSGNKEGRGNNGLGMTLISGLRARKHRSFWKDPLQTITARQRQLEQYSTYEMLACYGMLPLSVTWAPTMSGP
jgi:hypothetical protein